MNTAEYTKAVKISEDYLSDPVGYSTFTASGLSDKQIIRQNNVIICLLELIILKIDNLSKTSEEKSTLPPVGDKDITELISRINDMTIARPLRVENNITGQNKNIFGCR